MLKSEKDWRKAQRHNRIMLAGAVLLLLVHKPLANWIDGPQDMIRYVALGLFGGAVLGEVWTYRKPKTRPTPEEIETLERQNIPIMLISTLATWGMLACFLLVTFIEPEGPMFWTLITAGGGCLALSIGLLPRLIRHMRASRVAPELYDERSQQNLDKAYRQAFLLMFQCAFIGGLLLMWDVVTLPAEAVAMGLGLIGIMAVSLLWCWYDWKDSR